MKDTGELRVTIWMRLESYIHVGSLIKKTHRTESLSTHADTLLENFFFTDAVQLNCDCRVCDPSKLGFQRVWAEGDWGAMCLVMQTPPFDVRRCVKWRPALREMTYRELRHSEVSFKVCAHDRQTLFKWLPRTWQCIFILGITSVFGNWVIKCCNFSIKKNYCEMLNSVELSLL